MSPSICQAADALGVLFGVTVTYCTPKRLEEEPVTVVAFIWGENHRRAAEALVFHQKGAATVAESCDSPRPWSAVNIVTTSERPTP